MNFPFPWWSPFWSSPLVLPTERGGPEVTAASNDLQRWRGAGTGPAMAASLFSFVSGPAGPPSSCTLVLPTQGLLRTGGGGTWELALGEEATPAPRLDFPR